MCHKLKKTKKHQSDGETTVMLELWEMQSTPSLLCPGVIAPATVLSVGQLKLNSLLMLNWIA